MIQQTGGFDTRVKIPTVSLKNDLLKPLTRKTKVYNTETMNKILSASHLESALNQYPGILQSVDSYGYSLLWHAAIGNPNIDTVKSLLKAGAQVDMPIEAGSTVFMGTVFNGYLDIAEILRKAGANINHQNKNGHCALTMAIRSGRKESIAYMIRLPDIQLALKDIFGKYPIQYFNIESENTHRHLLAHALYKNKLIEPLDLYVHAVGLPYLQETDPTLYALVSKLRRGTKRKPSVL